MIHQELASTGNVISRNCRGDLKATTCANLRQPGRRFASDHFRQLPRRFASDNLRQLATTDRATTCVNLRPLPRRFASDNLRQTTQLRHGFPLDSRANPRSPSVRPKRIQRGFSVDSTEDHPPTGGLIQERQLASTRVNRRADLRATACVNSRQLGRRFASDNLRQLASTDELIYKRQLASTRGNSGGDSRATTCVN
jgi:hypothetical protein